MKKSTALLLGEVQKKMNGYAALLNFHLMNLCVKAEPAALLPVSLKINGEDAYIENAADITTPQEDQFEIFPKAPELLFSINKAIYLVHPDFKLEVKSKEEDEEDKYILCTMPEVNDDRHDTLMEGVKMASEAAKIKIDANFTEYMGKITAQLAGAKPEEIDEAKKNLEDIYNKHVDLCKEYRKNKEEEIENAYQKYLAKEKEKEQQQKEQEAAKGEKAGFSMKLEE